MPLYEFHCKSCGTDSEILVRSSDWKGTACPSCGKQALVKKLSVFAASNAENSVARKADSACAGPGPGGRCCGGGACGLN